MKLYRYMLGVSMAFSAQWVLADDPPPPASDLRAACASEEKRLCPNVQPGGGRIRECMAQHREELSNDCKQALIKARQARKLSQ